MHRLKFSVIILNYTSWAKMKLEVSCKFSGEALAPLNLRRLEPGLYLFLVFEGTRFYIFDYTIGID